MSSRDEFAAALEAALDRVDVIDEPASEGPTSTTSATAARTADDADRDAAIYRLAGVEPEQRDPTAHARAEALASAQVSGEDAYVDRALGKFTEAHPSCCQEHFHFDKEAVIRNAIALLQDPEAVARYKDFDSVLETAWKTWHDQTLTWKGISASQGKGDKKTKTYAEGFDVMDELDRRQQQYRVSRNSTKPGRKSREEARREFEDAFDRVTERERMFEASA